MKENKLFAHKGRGARSIFFALTILLSIALSNIHIPLTRAEINLGSSTENIATPSSPQQGDFYDSVYGRYWTFYHTENSVKYSYSTDKATWTYAGTLNYDTADFSLVYNENSGSPKVVFLVQCSIFDVCYLQGNISGSSISFSSEHTALDGSVVLGIYSNPVGIFDGASHLLIAAKHKEISGGYGVVTAESIEQYDTAITGFTGIKWVGLNNGAIDSISLLPATGTDAYLVIGDDSGNISAYKSDNTKWNVIGSNSNYGWSDIKLNGLFNDSDYVASMVSDGRYLYIGTYTGTLSASTNVSFGQLGKYDTRTGKFESIVGQGIDFAATAMTILGDYLYVGTDYSSGITAWDFPSKANQLNGKGILRYSLIDGSWSKVGLGSSTNGGLLNYSNGGGVYSLVPFDGKIYVGGYFNNDGDGNSAFNNIALYDPATDSFSSISMSGCSDQGIPYAQINTMHRFNDDLYIGGSFSDVSDCVLNTWNIVKYTPSTNTFSPVAVGETYNGLSSYVNTIDDDGTNLYFGGHFLGNADWTEYYNHIAKYNPTTDNLAEMGVAGSDSNGTNDDVTSIAYYQGKIYVGGEFYDDGNGVYNETSVSVYNPADNTFSPIGAAGGRHEGFGSVVNKVFPLNDRVYFGGSFSQDGYWTDVTQVENGIAEYNPVTDVIDTMDGIGFAQNSSPSKFLRDDNDGTSVYFVPSQVNPGLFNTKTQKMTKYTPSTGETESMGITSINGSIYSALTVDNYLYIGGSFTDINGSAYSHVARYNLTDHTWSAMSSGISGNVNVIKEIGGSVYFAGSFNTAGGLTSNSIAKYNTSTNTFSAVGTGGTSSANVFDIEAIGTDIYLGGNFTSIQGVSANYIAKYNTLTNSFSAIGGGSQPGYQVNTLIAKDSILYVGGAFSTIGGTAYNFLAKYSPTLNSYSQVGTGAGHQVYDLIDYEGDVLIYQSSGANMDNGLLVYDISSNTIHAIDKYIPQFSDSVVYAGDYYGNVAVFGGDILLSGKQDVTNTDTWSGTPFVSYYSPKAVVNPGGDTVVTVPEGNGDFKTCYTDRSGDAYCTDYNGNDDTFSTPVEVTSDPVSFMALSYDDCAGKTYLYYQTTNSTNIMTNSSGTWTSAETLYTGTDEAMNISATPSVCNVEPIASWTQTETSGVTILAATSDPSFSGGSTDPVDNTNTGGGNNTNNNSNNTQSTPSQASVLPTGMPDTGKQE